MHDNYSLRLPLTPILQIKANETSRKESSPTRRKEYLRPAGITDGRSKTKGVRGKKNFYVCLLVPKLCGSAPSAPIFRTLTWDLLTRITRVLAKMMVRSAIWVWDSYLSLEPPPLLFPSAPFSTNS